MGRRAGARIEDMRGIPKSLRQSVMALSEKQRAHLAHDLIASLDGEPESGVEEAWAETIARRVNELRTGKVKAVPWTEVVERARKRLARRRRTRQ